MVENRPTEVKRTVCQFSWACAVTARIKETDQRWTESLEVARNLLQGDHRDHKEYLGNILYFHATHVNPMWNNLKRSIRIGGHVFYVDKISNRN
jgi:spore germination cell wall hydrolase CwlJ-like protein